MYQNNSLIFLLDQNDTIVKFFIISNNYARNFPYMKKIG